MAVPSRIYDLSATAASNSPAGTDSIGTSLDDYLRAGFAITRGDLATKGSDIASSSTADVGAVQGLFHDITGTTTITSLGTVAAGVWKVLKFEGALTLTHNATSLILLGGANRTTVNGDVGIYVSEGSGNWREAAYFPAAGPTLTGQGITFPATQVASSDVNTLDDYEEGTWTPAVGGNATYTLQTGNYTKIGRCVTARITLTINVLGTGSASVISGLPFTATGSAGSYFTGALFWSGAAANYVALVGVVEGGTATIQLFGATAAANALSAASALGNAATVAGTVVYYV